MSKYNAVSARLARQIVTEMEVATGKQFAPSVVGVGSPTTFKVIERTAGAVGHYHWRWNRRTKELSPDDRQCTLEQRCDVGHWNAAGRWIQRP